MAAKKKSNPIHIKASNKGKLHKTLGVPMGQRIPESKLEQALHSSNPTTRKRAQFAVNSKKFSH